MSAQIASRTPVVPDRILKLIPYSPGKPIADVKRELGLTSVTKLASNENALGPSPLAVKAMQENLTSAFLYPDAASHDLITAMSERLNIPSDSLIFGNGSDEIIHLLGLVYLQQNSSLIQADPSFVRYEASSILADAECVKVPLSNWTHDLDAMADRITPNTRLIYVTNPNNPTGTVVGKAETDKFMSRVPGDVIVVFDEAYFEFADPADYPDTLQYIRDGRNVITLRTFSKAYGLAGLRLGYGISQPEIIDNLNRVREPFNVNLLAQAAGLAAMNDFDHLQNTRIMNKSGMEQITGACKDLGFEVTPTQANFLWIDTHRNSRELFQELLKLGVIVRSGDIFGAPTHLRVTIGTSDQNETFINAIRKVVNQ